jgi:hypothetical protein
MSDETQELLTKERKESAVEDSTDLILRRGKVAVGETHDRYRPLKEKTKIKYIAVATEWLKNGGNATEAYLSVYPTVKRTTATSKGCDVMGHPEVQEFLAECWNRASKHENIGPEYVFRELISASKVNVVDYLPDPDSGMGIVEHLKALPKVVQRRLRSLDLSESETPGQHGTAIHKNLKVKGLDPQRAIEMLAKALGIFAEAEQKGSAGHFDHAEMIEKGVARLHALGTLDTAKLYDEEGHLLD